MSENSRFARLKPLLIIIALILLSLPAIQPLLHDGMPRTDDGYLHLYRAIALDHSLRYDDSLYPRYSSGLVYGYGAALFNYFPPTSYYPTVFLHWAGLPFVQAWVGTLILFTWIAAGGAYLLGKEWAGDVGGFITAAAYVYSPYLLFDLVTRGTSSELAGLVLLTWVMWGFTRLAFYGQRRDFVAAVLTFSLFIPMHNLVTLHGTVMLAGYCAFLWLSSEQKIRVFSQLLIAAIVAVVMTAFFWMPALGETDYTKINLVVESLNSIDVTRSLRGLSDVFALPRTADPTQLQPPIPITLGWIQVILGVIGLVLAGWYRRQVSWRTQSIAPLQVVLLLIVIVVVFLQLPVSAIVWETVPLIGYSQFAWRTMGLPSLALALMAGIGGALLIDRIRTQLHKTVLFCVLLSALILYGFPWLYTTYTPVPAASIVDAQDFERRTGSLTLSSYSEYLPVATDPVTLNPNALQDAFAESEVIPRLTAADGVTIQNAEWQGTSGIIELQAEYPTTLVFDWLYVPGWEARFLDETTALAPLTVKPHLPQGFVSVDIPAGTHTLEIALHDTPLQSLAEWVSVAGAALLILIVIAGWYVWKPVDNALTFNRAQSIAPLQAIIFVVAIGIGLFAVKSLLIDHIDSPFKISRLVNDSIQNVDIAFNSDFSGEIRLLGMSLENRVKSGNRTQIRAFWTLIAETLENDYSTVLQLRDSQQNIIAESGSFYPGNLATSNWLPGYYVEEVIDLEIPPFTPPATYTLDISLFNPATQQHLDVLNEAGNPIAAQVVLGTLEVIKPDAEPSEFADSAASFENFNLLAISGIPTAAQVGDEMTIRWLWQMVENTDTNVQAQLVWLNARDELVATTPFVPLTLDYPTSQWQAGETWRGIHRLYVPANLESGTYTVAVRADNEQPIAIVSMQVETPERNFEMPDVEYDSGQAWDNGIQLLGYDDTVTAVTLYWQTTQQINQNLRLFVQVVDSNDVIVALTDGIPVDWMRPTTSWAVGEVITTEHDFGELPSGEYRIRVGWYDPITGNRVTVDGDDAFFLPDPFIVK